MIFIRERNTVQRELILETVRSLHTHPTAEEIYGQVTARCPSVSRATVYRNLHQLAEEGKILHIGVANGPDRFDGTVSQHCHFHCKKCGKLLDLELADPVLPKPCPDCGHTVTGYELTFSGYCRECIPAAEYTKSN
ncbi:MAG: transcriptional repressor [Clostridia bacterium]|nr:transcriptional repressor [Clostridia bacterium]